MLRRWHARRCRRLGLIEPALVLSFDCDTERDATVALALAERLTRRGIPSAFAVPADQLLIAAGPYRALLEQGAEILAHGFRSHTELRDGRYVSTLFYDDLDDAEIEEDVRQATITFREVLGVSPAGFRAPHFGTLSERRLALVRRAIAREGYVFSTSALPAGSFLRGPVHRADGVYEVPVSGAADAPLDVLDSYSFRYAPRRPRDPAAYAVAFTGLLRWAAEHRSPCLLNTYADPAHVHDWPPFWDAIDEAVRLGVSAMTFRQLVDRVGPSLA